MKPELQANPTPEKCEEAVLHYFGTLKGKQKIDPEQQKALAPIAADWILTRDDVVKSYTRGERVLQSLMRVLEQAEFEVGLNKIKHFQLRKVLSGIYSGEMLKLTAAVAGESARQYAESATARTPNATARTR